jgi:hypothetical protein
MTTKNGDLPAMPTTIFQKVGGIAECRSTGGLTKREQFAMAAMQGLLAKHGDDDYTPSQIASYAVERADALLAELERTNGL